MNYEKEKRDTKPEIEKNTLVENLCYHSFCQL